MKIVYCVTQLHGSGGIERVITTKANALVDRGHDVTIITTDQKGGKPFFELDKRIRTYDLGLNYKGDYDNPIWIRLYRHLKKKRIHKQKLTQLLYSIKADIVISTFMEEASFLPSIEDGSRKIVESHASILQYQVQRPRKKYDFQRCLDFFYKCYDLAIGQRFDACVLLTKEDLLLRGRKSNMIVIPNPLDNTIYSSSSENRRTYVLAIGRHTEQKNFSDLIDVWSVVSPEYPLWKLIIVGDGHLYSSLLDKINVLRLSSSVELLPPTKEIQHYYNEASIFVMTSLFEGLPMVLLETQAVGLPAISYECPCGPKDVIENGFNGFLVPSKNKHLFAHYLKMLMVDKDMRESMGANAQSRSKQYRLSVVIDQWEELFSRLYKKTTHEGRTG
ncbi:glycosyltransferase family 4 protein [Porphyromonas sp. COT-290 OH860]|uniref:glycosyltransferase family 4 protein n=1 Tax=Porphyromonas sp. COT-290 OH860 TaxID=1515615 RepID=UPI00052E2E9B|nr:glycosyltransferase family 4 protein [Porphyromonas sp. COT-290 OH860]KGN84346.1 hypothetical protein HQ41_04945 [Porphyromonas sp. COT-290 OH860]